MIVYIHLLLYCIAIIEQSMLSFSPSEFIEPIWFYMLNPPLPHTHTDLVLRFLLDGLRCPPVATYAAKAVQSICQKCKGKMAQHFDGLVQVSLHGSYYWPCDLQTEHTMQGRVTSHDTHMGLQNLIPQEFVMVLLLLFHYMNLPSLAPQHLHTRTDTHTYT